MGLLNRIQNPGGQAQCSRVNGDSRRKSIPQGSDLNSTGYHCIRCNEVLNFIDAEAIHTELLRDILINSKGYWGYSQEQLEKWRSNLKFEVEYVARNTVKLILKETEVIGFFAIVKGAGDKPNELDHLWLLPRAIGKGYGDLVFEQILSECKTLEISDFYIISDPDAEGFYLKKGAMKVGEVYSEPQKRVLPKLKYSVEKST